MNISPDSVSHKFVTKFSDVLFTKFGDLENSSPNLVINPSQNLTLNTLKLIPPYNTQPLPQSNGLLPRLDLDYPIVNRDDFFGCFQ